MTPEPSAEARRTALLVEFFDAVATADSEEDVLGGAAASAARWIGDASSVLILSPDRRRFEVAAVKARDAEAEALIRELAAASPLGADEGIAGHVLASGEPYFGEIPAEASKAEYAPFIERFPLQSLLAVPIATKQETIGVFELARYRSADSYTADDVSFLVGVASRTALAYANLRAHRREQANAARGTQVLADSPLATVLLTIDLVVESWNRAAERLFGWTADEIVGGARLPFVPPEREDESRELEQRIRAGETIDDFETVRVAKDGTPIDVAIYCATFGEGPAAGIALRFVDLRERKRSEALALEDATRAQMLAEFVTSAAEARDEREALEQLTQRTAEAFSCACAIYRVAAGDAFDVVALAGYRAADEAALRAMFGRQAWRADEGIVGQCFRFGETVLRALTDDEERAAYLASLPADRREVMAAIDLRSIIAVPLAVDGRRIGVLALTRFGDAAAPFAERDRTFAEELAGRTNLALGRLSLTAELRRTSATLRAMFDASPLATQLLDDDGRVLLWNPAAERLFGFSAAEAIGSRPPTIPPAELPGALDMASRVGRGEIVEGLPAKRVRKDGSEIDVLLYGSAIPDERGETRVLGIYTDMTERNRLERDLRQTSDTLRAILDGSPLPIIAADEAMRVTFWNRAAERLYGWTAAETVGQPVPFVPSDEPGVTERWRARLAAGETVEGGTRRRTKAGRELEIHLHSAPLFDEAGRYRGALGIHEDITERKRLEAELLQAQKMEVVGRLAGGVAHDFNNILTAIIGYSDLAEGMANEPELLRVLGTVKGAAERAAGLTQQLLAFSRRQMLQPRIVEANDVVLEIEPILRRVIGEDVELVASITPGVGSVLVDSTQLEQVILNLAVNARDAMPDGGRLVLRTDAAHFNGGHQPHLEMAPGDYVVISVADTGTGMDEETKAHIFEPFFTTKELGKGTGLGLSTTYGIVRQSGGYIWVYSEPGRGTTFKLYFPRVGPEAPAERQPELRSSTRRGRILLVEDEPTLRELGRIVLERRGYEVLVARDPATALELAEGSTFDLLATDVVMPGMTGIELGRRLREGQSDLRVLLMSGYSEDVTDAAGSMARRFLAKPFTPESLLRAVDEAIEADTPERR